MEALDLEELEKLKKKIIEEEKEEKHQEKFSGLADNPEEKKEDIPPQEENEIQPEMNDSGKEAPEQNGTGTEGEDSLDENKKNREEPEKTDETPKKKRFFGIFKGKKEVKDEKDAGLFRKKKDEMKQNIVRGVDLKEGNVSYDDNVITPDEFSLIEESEEKEKEEDEVKEIQQASEERISETNVVDQLVMKIERIDGRISAIDEINKAINERITGLSEEIGELRSSILEKERSINEIDSQSKRVMEAFEEIEPENFRKELEKKEEEIAKTQVSIESLVIKQKEIKDALEKIQGVMEKVKSFENLVEMAGKVNDKLSQIDETKKYTSRLASKVENIFSELNNSMKDFKNSIEKVEMNDETIKELMKSLDIMEIKVEKVVTKDQFEKIEKELKEEISNNKMEIEDKLYDLKDFLEDVVTKAGGVKLLKSRDIMPWRVELENRMKELEKLVGSSRKVLTKADAFRSETEDLRKEIKRLEGMIRPSSSSRKEPKSNYHEKVLKPSYTIKEVPPHIEKWIKENLGRGYSADQLKESLRNSGNDPSVVDKFVGAGSRKNQYVIG